MEHEVSVTIFDRGFLVIDGEYTCACNDGKELINCLARIKAAVQTEEAHADE